jgi:hypothetical protein
MKADEVRSAIASRAPSNDHAGNAVGQRAVEFQVQRAEQERQLFRVRIKRDAPPAFLDNFEVVPVDGFERDMVRFG